MAREVPVLNGSGNLWKEYDLFLKSSDLEVRGEALWELERHFGNLDRRLIVAKVKFLLDCMAHPMTDSIDPKGFRLPSYIAALELGDLLTEISLKGQPVDGLKLLTKLLGSYLPNISSDVISHLMMRLPEELAHSVRDLICNLDR